MQDARGWEWFQQLEVQMVCWQSYSNIWTKSEYNNILEMKDYLIYLALQLSYYHVRCCFVSFIFVNKDKTCVLVWTWCEIEDKNTIAK